MEKLLVAEANGKKAYLFADEQPETPRSWDNEGVMVCFHKRYSLGDEGHGLKSDQFENWDELKAFLRKEKGAKTVLPLYLYDHSGLRMKVGSFAGLLSQGHAEFDSGMVGFIYSTKRGKAVEARLRGEVETYDQYLAGDVWGYQIVKEKKCDAGELHEEFVDACSGYYGQVEAEKAAREVLNAEVG